MDILPTVQVASFVVASGSLAVNAYNSYATRRLNEVNMLFGITQKFADYAKAHEAITDTTSPHVARRAFLAMANYVENLCSIYRRGNGSGLVLRNIEAMVSDFIVDCEKNLEGSGSSYSDLLKKLGMGEDSFCDTFWFIQQKAKLLQRKRDRLRK